MKISKMLPQFERESFLLIVTGKQEAVFYIAKDGVITKVTSFKIKTPKYSDREGFFATRGHGKTFVSGSVYESTKEKVRQIFLKVLKKHVKEIRAQHLIKKSALFCPGYLINDIMEVFPVSFRKSIVFSFRGNYYEEHPFQLLEKIKGESINPPWTKEGRAILQKSERARKVGRK